MRLNVNVFFSDASLPEQAPPMVESAPSILVTEDTAVEEADGHDQIKLSPSCTVRCGFAHACQFKGGNCAFPKDCACDRFWFDKA